MLSFYHKTLLFLNIGLAWSFATPTRNLNNRAAYFLDNDPNGNFIIALKISVEDGTLSSPVRTSTGGIGASGLIAVSQDAVVVSENGYLFTVNSLSDTVSMFTIDNDDPWHPKLVGSPAPTLGNTPISVAYSKSLNIACVLNSIAPLAGVTCYAVSPTTGLTPITPLLPIPQPTDGTAPPGPLAIVADIVFNPSSTGVFVGVGSKTAAPGVIYAYAISNGKVSSTPIKSPLGGLTAPFSLNFLSSDARLFITQPLAYEPGAAILDVSETLVVTALKDIFIPGQLAECWVAYSPHGKAAYVVDAFQANVTVVDTESGDVRARFGYPARAAGGVDAAIDRGRLYLLTDDVVAPKVNVFKLRERDAEEPAMLVQSLDIYGTVGSIGTANGMAIYPS